MKRRMFLQVGTGAAVAAGMTALAWGRGPTAGEVRHGGAMRDLTAAEYRAARRYAELRFGRIAYIDKGAGTVALFLHGAPLNSFQWRGAIARLASAQRRCIAPDFMGLGYSEPLPDQQLDAAAQAEMLAALLDHLRIQQVDIVASDSGGAVAQLFAAAHPERVRTMLLTNCDVEPDSPPAPVMPVIELARTGKLADSTAAWLTDRALCRSTFGQAVFHDPARLADDTIDYYVTPLVSTPVRRKQYEDFHLALVPNPLAGLEAKLKRSAVPVRIVWGAADTIFPLKDAQYLDRTFPTSRGIRTVPEGKLFWQEEYPAIIAEEARKLWAARA
ncbi:alpha/beta hydrolase [Massilia arenosa]|uniref:Alpha/beta hydrolase n=2 Tax=Zemynaea arenosa TaxID=2561931 RepID=A0A4Y9SUB4_9BURK|nr:alpha/beta hydrolase [Massilia arenosa]